MDTTFAAKISQGWPHYHKLWNGKDEGNPKCLPDSDLEFYVRVKPDYNKTEITGN